MDAYSGVLNHNLQVLVVFNADFYENMPLFCEFHRVTLQAQEDLHDSLLVRNDEILIYACLIKVSLKFDLFLICLIPLNAHDLFDHHLDVELANVLPKFPCLNLRII